MSECPHLIKGRRRRDGKCAIDKAWRGLDCKDNRPPAPCCLPVEHPLYCAEEECPWRNNWGTPPKIKAHNGYRRSQKDIDLRSHAVQEGHLVGIRLGQNAMIGEEHE